jgi:hypothetical protein
MACPIYETDGRRAVSFVGRLSYESQEFFIEGRLFKEWLLLMADFATKVST